MLYFGLALIPFITGFGMSFLGNKPMDHIKYAANGVGVISVFYLPFGGIAAIESDGYAHYWLVVGVVGIIVALLLSKLAKTESSVDPIFN